MSSATVIGRNKKVESYSTSGIGVVPARLYYRLYRMMLRFKTVIKPHASETVKVLGHLRLEGLVVEDALFWPL